ncbi:hypothetical protein [Paenibacillus dakarensis]|uniref:hypothetical protein n=1 Tax=Paenibacillus dakarensis TaxID=1527293 RepID=UPI0006D5B3D6|nr:hypothetical protein [Paenibacillus dakarensis]
MQTVNQAMKIISKDIKNDKMQVVWTIVFTLYMGVVLSFNINSMFQEAEYVNNPFSDFLMLIFSPMMGYYISRRTFKYLNEDSFTQMLSYYRSIPVPMKSVIMSRALMGIIGFIVNGIIFFGITYAIAADLQASMDLAEYAVFGLTWIGIGILINGFYIYMEFTRSGKAYFWLNILLFVIIALVIIGLFISGARFSMFSYFVDASKEWKWLSPCMWGSLIIGISGYVLFCRLTYQRVRLRDLS